MTITTTGLSSTSSTPAVAYVAASGNLLDASAATNEMANGATANAADQVKPTFVKAWQYDTDDNGNLDEIVIEMSESISDATVNKAHFSLSSGSINSIGVNGVGTANPKDPDVVNDKYFTLEVTISGTTTVTTGYTAGTLADLLSNTALTDAAITSGDVTSPQLWYAVLDADNDGTNYTYVDVYFTEAMDTATELYTDFSINDTNIGITAIQTKAGNLVTLKCNRTFQTGDSPTIGIAGSVADLAGNALTSGTITINTYRISMRSGWNLISLPADTSNTLISTVVSGIDSNLAVIWHYNASANAWSQWTDIGDNGEFRLEPGQGYWVYMTSADTLIGNYNLMPETPTSPPYFNLAGQKWNLIGHWQTYNQTASTNYGGGLTSLSDDDIGSLFKFTGTGYVNILNGAQKMVPGQGFWMWKETTGNKQYTPS
ncbi:MAG TPA: hypothetical protein DSN98_02055 [Thermoplasmata archaeon]|nr:MAG TPA: hypothetical protein DSN98_02055 [Thermoplasmata archaeon]